ncbi:MAG: hypothetical protein ABSG44_05470 [Thermodesulfobacteriota bacterium]|jgi:hypothetical protein
MKIGRFIGHIVVAFLISSVFSFRVEAATINAANCSSSAVQTAINSASNGDTVIIPNGSCTWTSGLTISNYVKIVGAGSGRIIAYSNAGSGNYTVGSRTQSFSVAGFSPGFSSSYLSNGTTLKVSMENNRANWMQGTVTSYSAPTLTMNITSTGGSGSGHTWLISTVPASSTVIVNNASVPIFTITESTAGSINISGVHFAAGTAHAAMTLGYASGGYPILIHDNWFEAIQVSGEQIDSTTNRGVIWNNSFDASSTTNSLMVTVAAFRIKGAPASSWTTASTMGTADTTGQSNAYVELNDFHAYQSVSDLDDNSRCVWRFNLMDHAEFGTHGPDTSNYGQRHFEYYNNTGVYYGYSDGTTLNFPNGWVGLLRGGTGIVYNNVLPLANSSDYGSSNNHDVKAGVMNLQRNGGPNPCWAAEGPSCISATAGQYYPAPRQVGMGYITGTGKDGLGSTTDSITYVGDSEPVYIWNNVRSQSGATTALYVVLFDGAGAGTNCGNLSACDSSSNYIESGRDYFNTASTAKAGYTPYTCPHPLTGLSGSCNFSTQGIAGYNVGSGNSIPAAPQGLAIQGS